jgi:hypothetical protein
MVNFLDLRLNFCFTGIIIRLPVFPVVVVSIGAYVETAEKPSQPQGFVVLFNKPISL